MRRVWMSGSAALYCIPIHEAVQVLYTSRPVSHITCLFTHNRAVDTEKVADNFFFFFFLRIKALAGTSYTAATAVQEPAGMVVHNPTVRYIILKTELDTVS